MAIINLTPHAVCVFADSDIRFEPSIRKYVTESNTTPITVIPSSGVVSAKVDTVKSEVVVDGIPTFKKVITGCDNLPDGDDICIVSALYASAYRSQHSDTSRLFTVADTVYSEDGKTIIGCRGICPAF